MKFIRCKKCQAEVSVDATRCSECGWELPLDMCPECGSMNTRIVSGGLYNSNPNFRVSDGAPKYLCRDCGKRFG